MSLRIPPSGSRARRRTVCFQAGVIASLIAAALVLGGTAKGATSTIGRTWPIAEPDALAEIGARTARQPATMAAAFGPRAQWSALKPAALGRTREDRTRSVVPFYTLGFDLTLPDGKVLYRKGYRFNPLEYVRLPQRLFVVHAADLGWAARTASLTDWILLTAGDEPHDDRAHQDALSLGERIGRSVFILEERVKDRLGLTVAPVIVRQVGQSIELSEIRLERRFLRKVRP